MIAGIVIHVYHQRDQKIGNTDEKLAESYHPDPPRKSTELSHDDNSNGSDQFPMTI